MRDPANEKASWMRDHFDNAYGKGKFEMVQVRDMAEKGCLDEAVKGKLGFLKATGCNTL